MSGKGLIDNEFDVDDDLPTDFRDDDPPLHDEPREVPKSLDTDEIEIVVKDDTPDDDKGKWSADDLPTDEPEEDEATKYSRRVQKRIERETAKTHAERRAKEDRERQLLEATEYMRNLIRENSQLKEMVESGEKVLISEHQGRLEGEIAAAKAAYREAHEAGDVNGMLAAQENLTKATAKLQQIATHQVRPLPRTEESEAEKFYRQAQQQAPAEDPTAKAWAARNPWFMRDEAMTFIAMDTHKKLIASGVMPDTKEYYTKIDGEMRKRFPDRFEQDRQPQRNAPRRTENVVAPASRSASGAPGTRTRVVLTETQVKLARRLGLTAEQYAAQVAAEHGANGEWTHGKP